MNFTLALAQVDSVLGDMRRNIQKHVEFTQRAKAEGANVIVFPELSLSGYTVRDINWEAALRLPADDALSDLLELSRDISIIVGGIEESEEFGVFNSAFLMEDGKAISVHRKIYPPTYGMFEELRYFSPGKFVRAFDTKVGRLGVLICEDLWHLPLPYILAEDKAQVIITLAASPTRVSGEPKKVAIAQINTEHHCTFARLLSSYVAFCNRVGFEDGVNFWGGSELISPSGDVVVQAKLFDEDMVFATINENEIRRARRSSRHFIDDDPRLVINELRRIINARSWR